MDLDARAIAALRLVGGTFKTAGQVGGTLPAALPPLDGLSLDPAAIWS